MSEATSSPRPSAIPPPTRHTAPPKTEQRPPVRERLQNAKETVKGNLTARAKAVKEIIGLACIPLAGAAAIQTAKAQRNEEGGGNFVSPYSLDVYTVQMHSDALSEAIAEFGDHYPVLGATLDKLAALTPGAAIFGVGMMVAMQIAENHGRLSEQARAMVPAPIVSRQELAEQMITEAREAAEKANSNGFTPTAA